MPAIRQIPGKLFGRPLTFFALAIALLLSISWGLSHLFYVRVRLDGPHQTFLIVSGEGRLYLQHGTKDFSDWEKRGGAPGRGVPPNWSLSAVSGPAENFGWLVERYYVDPPLMQRWDLDWWKGENSAGNGLMLVGSYPPAMDLQQLTIGYWLVTLLAIGLPVIRAVRYLWNAKRRRAAAGLCENCGYDRRAHGPADRCPECGMVPASNELRDSAT